MAEVTLLPPPGPLGTLTLGTRLPCCEEAQTTWRGNVVGAWVTAPIQPTASISASQESEKAFEMTPDSAAI